MIIVGRARCMLRGRSLGAFCNSPATRFAYPLLVNLLPSRQTHNLNSELTLSHPL